MTNVTLNVTIPLVIPTIKGVPLAEIAPLISTLTEISVKTVYCHALVVLHQVVAQLVHIKHKGIMQERLCFCIRIVAMMFVPVELCKLALNVMIAIVIVLVALEM